ncbi:MAG: hypothetical protein ACR2RB_12140 [Gammaproteobacteria bacterium]
MNKGIVGFLTLLLASPVLLAQPAGHGQPQATAQIDDPTQEVRFEPDAEAIQLVQHYYFDGAGTAPVMVELKFCEDVYKEGGERNNCKNPLDKDELTAGEPFYVWMNLLVPRGEGGDGAKVLVQFNHKGVTRTARTLLVNTALRYRTWTKVRVNDTGEWQMPVFVENSDGIQQLKDVTFNVGTPKLASN